LTIKVSGQLHDGRVHFGDFHHHVQRLDALGGVARADINNQVISSSCQVVDGFDHAVIVDTGAVDSLQGFLAIDAHDLDDALGVVDFRDKIDDDARAVADGAAQVVDVGKVRRIALTLTGEDGAAAGLVRLLAKRGGIDAGRSLHLVNGQQCGLLKSFDPASRHSRRCGMGAVGSGLYGR
jgi:hypothetical protein